MHHIDPPHIRERNAHLAASKLALCIRNAWECSRFIWSKAPDITPAHRREYKRLRRESMQDARYWRDQLREATQ